MIVVFDTYENGYYTPFIKNENCNKNMKFSKEKVSWLYNFPNILGMKTYKEVLDDFDEEMQYLIFCDVKNSDYVFGKHSTIYDYITTKQKRFVNKKNVGLLFCEIAEGWKEKYLNMIWKFCEDTKTSTEKIYYATSCETMKNYYTDMGYNDADDKFINVLYYEFWFEDTRRWMEDYIIDTDNKKIDLLVGIEDRETIYKYEKS